eukprot:2520901-Amphidinium_carterae.1
MFFHREDTGFVLARPESPAPTAQSRTRSPLSLAPSAGACSGLTSNCPAGQKGPARHSWTS